MSNRNFLLKGTLLLTLSGFLTKIIGFIYRIFLSQKSWLHRAMGIYQLIFPFTPYAMRLQQEAYRQLFPVS